GSIWSNATSLFLGDGDQGNRLLVSNGGVVQSSFGFIGLSFASSNNLALLTGAGSLWTNSQTMNVGFSGSRNQLIASNGATLSVGGAGVLGNNTGANSNSATVIGPGTRWLLGSDFYVGSNGGFNLLLVSDGGQVADTTPV